MRNPIHREHIAFTVLLIIAVALCAGVVWFGSNYSFL